MINSHEIVLVVPAKTKQEKGVVFFSGIREKRDTILLVPQFFFFSDKEIKTVNIQFIFMTVSLQMLLQKLLD